MNFMGIDPGKNGGIAVISGNGDTRLFMLPKIGNDINLVELGKIFDKVRAHIAQGAEYRGGIEQVHSIHGSSAKSNFEFGESAGLLRMGMVSTGMGWEAVQPKTWQKELFEGVVPQWKKNDSGKDVHDTKAMAYAAITRLYPNAIFLPTIRSSKPHEGLVDALCIAHYIRLRYNQQ